MGYTREVQWYHLSTGLVDSQDSPHAALGKLLVKRSKPKPTNKVEELVQSAQHPTETPTLPQQLSLDAFEEDFCFAYIFSNFVWRGYGTSWLYQSAQGQLGQLAFDSAKALAETSFGKSHKSYQTEMQGRIKYGKALRCLIKNLGDTQGSPLRGLVIPVLLLLMHSVSKPIIHQNEQISERNTIGYLDRSFCSIVPFTRYDTDFIHLWPACVSTSATSRCL